VSFTGVSGEKTEISWSGRVGVLGRSGDRNSLITEVNVVDKEIGRMVTTFGFPAPLSRVACIWVSVNEIYGPGNFAHPLFDDYRHPPLLDCEQGFLTDASHTTTLRA
jgi:hypothetical protein